MNYIEIISTEIFFSPLLDKKLSLYANMVILVVILMLCIVPSSHVYCTGPFIQSTDCPHSVFHT